MPVSEWQAAEDKRDKAFREGRYSEAYGKPAHSDAEIEAAWIATFKAESEWRANDIVDIITGTRERQSGVITGPVKGDQVMVLFADGIHWSYYTSVCSVRRHQT